MIKVADVEKGVAVIKKIIDTWSGKVIAHFYKWEIAGDSISEAFFVRKH